MNTEICTNVTRHIIDGINSMIKLELISFLVWNHPVTLKFNLHYKLRTMHMDFVHGRTRNLLLDT